MPIISADWVYEKNDDGTIDHYLLGPKGGRSDVPVTSTDASGNTVLVGGGGSVLCVFDVNGNIVAQVTPRTDTLANLLAVTDAGIGEIASATDVDAIVKYLGTPSVGKAYYINKQVGRLTTNVEGTSVPTGTATTLPLSNAPIDTLGAVDLANDWITVPAGVTDAEIYVGLTGLLGDGTYRKLEVEYDVTGGGVWINFGSLINTVANVASLVSNQYVTFRVGALGTYAGKRLRFRFTHNATGALVSVSGTVRIDFFVY